VKRTRAGLIEVDPATQATSRAGVWAAGDCANGGTTVVQAVAEGLRAARAISGHLGISG
jgi:formate dehydrogenase (NADP+) beta subunit